MNHLLDQWGVIDSRLNEIQSGLEPLTGRTEQLNRRAQALAEQIRHFAEQINHFGGELSAFARDVAEIQGELAGTQEKVGIAFTALSETKSVVGQVAAERESHQQLYDSLASTLNEAFQKVVQFKESTQKTGESQPVPKKEPVVAVEKTPVAVEHVIAVKETPVAVEPVVAVKETPVVVGPVVAVKETPVAIEETPIDNSTMLAELDDLLQNVDPSLNPSPSTATPQAGFAPPALPPLPDFAATELSESDAEEWGEEEGSNQIESILKDISTPITT